MNCGNLVVELSKEDAEYLKFNIQEIDRMYNENADLRSINRQLYDIFSENGFLSISEIVPTITSDRIDINYSWLYSRFISIVNLLFRYGYDDAAKFMFTELSNKYSIW